MAEYYQDVIKEFKRMCKYYDGAHKPIYMECPLYERGKGCNISHCRLVAFDRPVEFAASVMLWSAEHPKPVYPTWGEWFLRTCQVPLTKDCRENDWLALMRSPIPADIAQNLGIEPKEG